MPFVKKVFPGLLLAAALACLCVFASSFVPYHLISGGVFALLFGMLLNPLVSRWGFFKPGLAFVAKKVLRTALVLMGLTLSLTQVFQVGKFSLFVMVFTLLTAFGGGFLLGRAFGMDWKLSGLISAGTGSCGGSAIAAIAPVIDAKDRDIAYAISATFIFDVVMVVLFPLAGRYAGMSDMGFGLWAGTAINDTSSVVAAGYAFSDAAGGLSVIVKLTRTLSIIPAVILFSIANERISAGQNGSGETSGDRKSINYKKIFPYFILLFLAMVTVNSLGFIPAETGSIASVISKFMMVAALGAIGLETGFKEMLHSGFKPMLHGFIISALVVVVSFVVQVILGQV